jgi:hypothetical protein
MPENEETQLQSSEPESDSNSPPTEPTSGEHTSALERTGFRFGDAAPQSLQGRTAAETAEYVKQLENQQQQMINSVQQYVATQAQQQQPPQQQAQAIDPDLMITDPAAWQRQFATQMSQGVQQYINQAGVPLYQGQAATAKSLSRKDPDYQEVWQKYGSEVERLMANVPLAQQANPEIWNQAAKIVKSEHLDDFIHEKAKNLAATLGATEQGGTGTALGVGAPTNEDIQRIRDSAYGKTNLGEYSDAQIQRTAEKMGHSIKEFADLVQGTHIVAHPKNRGEWYNRDLVRDVNPEDVRNG